MKKYVVDASILIDAAKNYPMDIDYFKAIWNRFDL